MRTPHLPKGTASRQDFSAEDSGSRGRTCSTGPKGRRHRSPHAHATAHSGRCVLRQLLQTGTFVLLSRRPALGDELSCPHEGTSRRELGRQGHPHVLECLRLTPGHLRIPSSVAASSWVWAPRPPPPAAPGPQPAGLRSAVLLPLDVQQHEYSDFLLKTNLEFSLSKGLLITKNRLRRELIDRPTWPLLRNKLAIGRAADKGKCQGLVIYELLGRMRSASASHMGKNTCQTSGDHKTTHV